MAPQLELSIPSSTLQSPTSGKAYTLYNITLRLPLRSYILQKRYSDFVTLDNTLRSLTTTPPPAPLPAKSWFRSTANSAALTESRRAGLETYLRAILDNDDRRWRDTSAWRAFLNLPSSTATANSSRAHAHANLTTPGTGADGLGAVLSDERAWLDVHREMRGQLHDARLHLGRRDGATVAKAQREAGAEAKRCLVRAGQLLEALEVGLAAIAKGDGAQNTARALGEGEMRRRRDLLASARVERDGLERLGVSLAGKSNGENGDGAGANGNAAADKAALFGPGVTRPSGRVLGAPIPETAKTRELDNEGVLQLQKQMMKDQDLDVEELGKIVRRQREMGLAINEELVLQNEMLSRVDEDVDRVKGKIDIARKRIKKIN